MATDQSANLRVRISADLNDIRQGLAALRGQFETVRKDAAKPVQMSAGDDYAKWWSDQLTFIEQREQEVQDTQLFESRLQEARKLQDAAEYVQFWQRELAQLDAAEAAARDTQVFEQRVAEARRLQDAAEYVQFWERELAQLDAAEAAAQDTRVFDERVAESRRLYQAAEYVQWWEKQVEDMARTEREVAGQNQFLRSLQQQAAAIGKTRSELLEMEAAERGVSQQAAPLIARLRETEAGARRSSRELAMVTPQLTDIFVSIQGGMPLTTVLLQQGGQLRDVAGGVVPALKMVGNVLVGMVNPLTISAAAVGALVLAGMQATEQQTALRMALITTGDYAGRSATQLHELVEALDGVAGVSRGSAADAVLQVAQSGRFAGEQFDQVARAAARMQSATGQSVETTVDKFKDLAKAPVDTLLKLNESEHFLTQAQLARVQALIDEGREQDAASVAINEYSGHLDRVADRAERAMPAMARWWRDIKDETTSAWGEVQTYSDLLARVIAQQGRLRSGWTGSPTQALATGSGTLLGPLANMLPDGTASVLNAMTKQWLRGAGGADFSGVTSRVLGQDPVDSEEAEEDLAFRKQTVALQERQLDLEGRIKKMREDAAKAGRSATDIDAREAAMRAEDAADRAKKASDEAARKRKAQLAEEKKEAEALARGYASVTEQLERQIALTGDSSQLARVQYEMDNGSLQGLSDAQKADLRNLAQVSDAVSDYEAIYSGLDGVAAKAQETTSQISQYSVQAARNMQSDFADYLFDPFAKGADGMLEGFSDTLRRMAAELSASKIFDAVGNWASGYTGTGAGWINAIGEIIGGAERNAKGGVYVSPSLSAYSGQIVSQPTLFAFARGAGIMGEAGPEAILPLRRGSDGRLGVAADVSGAQVGGIGGLQVQFNIQNNTGGSVAAQQTGVRRDGNKLIVDMLLGAVAGDIAGGGKVAGAMKGRFGLRESR